MEMKKVLGGMEQDLPRLQHRAQISGFIYRQESEGWGVTRNNREPHS